MISDGEYNYTSLRCQARRHVGHEGEASYNANPLITRRLWHRRVTGLCATALKPLKGSTTEAHPTTMVAPTD